MCIAQGGGECSQVPSFEYVLDMHDMQNKSSTISRLCTWIAAALLIGNCAPPSPGFDNSHWMLLHAAEGICIRCHQ